MVNEINVSCVHYLSYHLLKLSKVKIYDMIYFKSILTGENVYRSIFTWGLFNLNRPFGEISQFTSIIFYIIYIDKLSQIFFPHEENKKK